MNVISVWPDNLLPILLNDEGHILYGHIQNSAKKCLADLTEAFSQKEVSEDKHVEIEQSVNLELKDAGEFRFSLITTDNRIRREKQINPLLKRYIAEAVRNGKSNNNELIYDLLSEPQNSPIDPEVLRTANVLQPDVHQSLSYRLQMTWCWDEILSDHRKLSICRVICLGHILTEGALLLQDSTTTQKVREILSSLEIKIPKEPLQFHLPSGTMELRNLLANGSRKLERTQQHILRLDQQRQCLRESQEVLAQRIESVTADQSEDSDAPVPSYDSGDPVVENQQRMTFKPNQDIRKNPPDFKE